jgi:hypothetical protein
VALFFLVERARKCLDFSCTVFLFHLLLTAVHSGFPTLWPWWVLVVCAAGVASVVGEQLCMRRELSEM